jgi:hypothetical protein
MKKGDTIYNTRTNKKMKVVRVVRMNADEMEVCHSFDSEIMQHCCHLIEYKYRFMVRVMVFNATFKKISVLSWWSVLLVGETRVPGENHRPAVGH